MKIRRIAVPFLAGSLLLAGLAAPADAWCKRMRVTASGLPVGFRDKEPDKKQKNAIRAWEFLARKQAGEAFASWKNAQSKEIKCWHVNRSLMQCAASARPCNGE